MSDTKSDLLAPLLALVAKWDASVDVAEAQRDKDGAAYSHAAAAYHAGLADAYRRCHDELQTAISSLAAHRGEVIGYVRRAPFYTRDVWQGCTKAEHDFINANGYWTNPKDGFNWPSITRPVYDARPPQAQVGAGDALEDAMLAKAYRQESAAFAADSEISVGAKIERRYRELLAAALEARHEPE